MKYIINEGQRALVFKDGKLIDYLKEGNIIILDFLIKFLIYMSVTGSSKQKKDLIFY